MNKVMFACTSLVGVNKVGNLKKTPEGYYPMVVGALDVFNSAGQFYALKGAEHLFESSSSLMRRVNRGALRGEYGHPNPPPASANKEQQKIIDKEFARRALTIEELNVCCHHRRLWLDNTVIKDKNNQPIVAIMSEVMPSGPLGHVLEKQLNNPHENVCFSIRSFTDNKKVFGIERRVLREVVTFDYVNEPGISVAEKYFSPALESRSMSPAMESLNIDISRHTLEEAIDSRYGAMAMESVLITAESLFANMGWGGLDNRPSYAKW